MKHIFTIGVNKQVNNEFFSFYNIKMVHRECYCGSISILDEDDGNIKLQCTRCGDSVILDEHWEIQTIINISFQKIESRRLCRYDTSGFFKRCTEEISVYCY